jgi:ABC-type amino acid transport substrate-binding protein
VKIHSLFLPVTRLLGSGLAVLLATASLSLGVHAQSLKIGFFDVPPHVAIDASGLPIGPAVNLFKAVAQKMGVTDLRYQQLPLVRLLLQLESGETDVAIFISKTPEREAKFHYPSKPYYQTQPGLAVNSASPLMQIKTTEDIKALKIGTMQGSVLSASLRQPYLQLTEISGTGLYARAIQMLLLDRLDAVYSPDANGLLVEARMLDADKKIRVLALPDPANGIYCIFSKKAAAVYASKYDLALEAVIKERGDYPKAFLK